MQNQAKPFFNKKLIYLLLIIILGFILRVIFIDKPGGVWLDEGQTYSIANESFPFGIISRLYRDDFHPPLYFFILHIWMHFFGTSDVTLRFLSALIGTFSIFFAYLVGKELKDDYTGLIVALFVSINSLFIYYSQEIRFYALSVMLSTLAILFLLKILNDKENKIKNYILFSLINLLLIYTATLALIFVFVELFVLVTYLYIKKEIMKLKKLILIQLAAFILYIPYLGILFHQIKISSTALGSPIGWVYFDFSDILLIIQNWFSPTLSGLYNNIPHYINFLKGNNFLIMFFFTILPLIVGFIGIIRGIKEKNKNIILFFIVIIFISIEIYGALTGKLAFITRYTLIISSLAIFYSVYGLTCFKSKFISSSLIISYVAINLIYLTFCNFSAPKMFRFLPIKTAEEGLNSYKLTPKDIIFMPYGGRYLNKYYSASKARILPLDPILIATTYKNNDLRKFYGDEILANKKNKNLIYILNQFYKENKITKSFEAYFKENVFDKIESGRYLVIVTSPYFYDIDEQIFGLTSQANFPPIIGGEDVLSDKIIAYPPFQFQLLADRNFQLVTTRNIPWWTIAIYKKV